MWERCDACFDGSAPLPPEPLPVIEILTARDDRLQKQEDKRFTEERRRVRETGLSFFASSLYLLCSVEETRKDGKSKD